MNVKNIIKVVALAMLMPAMLLNSACSNEDEPILDNENAPTRGYPLYVSVNATRQGDAGTNRASFDGSHLNFSDGDKLFVTGVHVGGVDNHFAGLLDYDDGTGKFSGTIYTERSYTGTPEDLFGATMTSVTAYLFPAGYESKDFITKTGSIPSYNDIIPYGYPAYNNAFALTKAAAVEQFSYEKGDYNSGTSFILYPQSAILNFTITGLAASTNVTATLTDGSSLTISGEVTTNASGTATFAMGVAGSTNLNGLSLSVAGNPITLVSSDKTLVAGKIYNITRAVTPPTLAQTMTNAGMTVKVKYNYADEVNYCLFSSNGDETYTFQSGDGWAGGDAGCAKALVVESGKLVFKQNVYDTIEDTWSNYGFSVTFDTSNNTYSNWVGKFAQEYHNPSFISVEVNSVPIALTQIITVSDLVKTDGQGWFAIIYENSDKIKEEGGYVVRISDGAKLQRDNWGIWQDVTTYDNYKSMDTYKFEGD